MRKRPMFVLVPIFGLLLCAALPAQETETYRLKIGDARFKDKTVEIVAGQIVSMETGKPVTFEQMIKEM